MICCRQSIASTCFSDRSDPILVVFPLKDQALADIVRARLKDLSQKIHTTVQSVFVSQKIEPDLKLREAKPPIVNQQGLVYRFECDLCDAGYVSWLHTPPSSPRRWWTQQLFFINWETFSGQKLFGFKGSYDDF